MHPLRDESRQFNEAARVGGPLDQIVEERKCYFVVDRVVGGCPYGIYNGEVPKGVYKFDQKLIEHYRSLLGGKFLGGQIHEAGQRPGQ